ncbi:hypothetical protein FISHEDRAFT_75803 [Fistulina hepatica ATCC 64428]|uniref:BTB domain-containing protein n=1 Tax=Fistulina hepatica ATCC 64428 TaxID=1128425 RepID=A0A0D7A787_9AGAR|nr:hypothetical protein FISHEDRAFT_75803 [Fistulina hepatica ATCC 64428]
MAGGEGYKGMPNMAPYTASTSKSSASTSTEGSSRSVTRMHDQREQAAAKAYHSISGSAQMRCVASGEGAPVSVIIQQQRPRRVTVPRHLFRPVYCRRYSPTNMAWDGKQLLASLARSANMKTVPAALALTLENMTSYVPPTHVLALRGPNARHPFLVYPVHDHVLRVQCPRLAAILDAGRSAGEQEKIPTVPFSLPVPQLFSPLLAFLYMRDATTLIAATFPELMNSEFVNAFRSVLSFDENVDLLHTVTSIIEQVSRAYSGPDMLLRLTVRVAALYKDACNIGVCDEIFWHTLKWIWYVVVTAIRRVPPSA